MDRCGGIIPLRPGFSQQVDAAGVVWTEFDMNSLIGHAHRHITPDMPFVAARDPEPAHPFVDARDPAPTHPMVLIANRLAERVTFASTTAPSSPQSQTPSSSSTPESDRIEAPLLPADRLV